MYKIFEIKYNDGTWFTGSIPNFYYIAKNKEDVILNSNKYKDFLEQQKYRGGDIWITEVSGLAPSYHFENFNDFDISISLKKKDSDEEV